MTKTLSVADLHGRMDILDTVLAIIEHENPDIVVFTGDYIDRGPHSKQVLDTVFDLQKEQPNRFILLKGNHEDMLVQVMEDYDLMGWWAQNGGAETIHSFDPTGKDPTLEATLKEYAKRVDDLTSMYEDEHRIFVHAAFGDTDEIRLWKRYRDMDDYPEGPKFDKSKFIVHGHTPRSLPFVGKHRANLDLGSFYSGQTGVAVFDNDVEGPPIRIYIANADGTSVDYNHREYHSARLETIRDES